VPFVVRLMEDIRTTEVVKCFPDAWNSTGVYNEEYNYKVECKIRPAMDLDEM